MSYRVGLLGARAERIGLGYQAKSFFDFVKPSKTLVVDVSMFERDPKRVLEQSPNWYPGATFIKGFPEPDQIREFLKDVDIAFVMETPYNYEMYRIARELGVKTVCQPNYEFFDYFLYQWPKPDMLILPTMWHYDELKQWGDSNNIKVEYLHCPVDRTRITRRHIDQAKRFIHIAGRPAAHDRNGTQTFLEAAKDAKQFDIKAIVYTQSSDQAAEIERNYPGIEVKLNVTDNRYMYQKGDVLVLPRRYGGNCLVLNEALAAGIPVIMSNISPNNQFLPREWLVHAEKIGQFEPRTVIDIYECKPHELLLKMLWFSSLSEEDMLKQSDKADELAESISWTTLLPRYEEVIEKLCQQ